MIQPSISNIFFFWNGAISQPRMKILEDCVYSTRVHNPTDPIYLISDTLKNEDFSPSMGIQVLPLTDDFFEGVPVDQAIVAKYRAADPRCFSDFFRLVLLYKFGGSYVDTDDLCIRQYDRQYTNVICRSYDPHTAFYNQIPDSACVPGIYREIRGYDHIPFFPRNDCWANFKPKHIFFDAMFYRLNELGEERNPITILGSESFQSLTLKVAQELGWGTGPIKFQFGLNLLYLFEDFVAGCSSWDRGDHGGEMHDLYDTLEMPFRNQPWGHYKCDQTTASYFFGRVGLKYPTLTHLWLHSKDQEPEWFVPVDQNELYYLSTWAYHWQKDLIETEKRRLHD
jgi:hypothetical protein